MMDLGFDWLHGALDRLLSWIVTQLESDAPTDPPPVSLPSGVVFQDAGHARIAARCLGLRALVRGHRGDRPGIARVMSELAEAKGRQPATHPRRRMSCSRPATACSSVMGLPRHRATMSCSTTARIAASG